MKVPIFRTTDSGFRAALRKTVDRRHQSSRRAEDQALKILRAVRKAGDKALIRFTERFDGIKLRPHQIEVKRLEIKEAAQRVDREDLRALRQSARRIAEFHERLAEKSWHYRDSVGLELGQNITPLDRVGVYVPGGKATYPSSVLMNVIPAKVAGVREVVMVSPLGENSNLILAAARIARVNRVFRIGGAQAIAALAFGTETVPRVDKIVGPGNIYVTTAKRLVFGEVDIDSIAGPSEILILADSSADPVYVAVDMLSQAEHDELAASFCVTVSSKLAREVQKALAQEIKQTRRRAIAMKALRRYGAIFLARNLTEGIDIVNAIAPEHVELMVRDPEKWVGSIRHAGAIFVGPYSTPPLGDYMAGPNHVLPTGGSARFFSPLGTYDFLKRTSVIRAGRKALESLAPGIIRLARMEGLTDHARAVEVRFQSAGKGGLDGKKR